MTSVQTYVPQPWILSAAEMRKPSPLQGLLSAFPQWPSQYAAPTGLLNFGGGGGGAADGGEGSYMAGGAGADAMFTAFPSTVRNPDWQSYQSRQENAPVGQAFTFGNLGSSNSSQPWGTWVNRFNNTLELIPGIKAFAAPLEAGSSFAYGLLSGERLPNPESGPGLEGEVQGSADKPGLIARKLSEAGVWGHNALNYVYHGLVGGEHVHEGLQPSAMEQRLNPQPVSSSSVAHQLTPAELNIRSGSNNSSQPVGSWINRANNVLGLFPGIKAIAAPIEAASSLGYSLWNGERLPNPETGPGVEGAVQGYVDKPGLLARGGSWTGVQLHDLVNDVYHWLVGGEHIHEGLQPSGMEQRLNPQPMSSYPAPRQLAPAEFDGPDLRTSAQKSLDQAYGTRSIYATDGRGWVLDPSALQFQPPVIEEPTGTFGNGRWNGPWYTQPDYVQIDPTTGAWVNDPYSATGNMLNTFMTGAGAQRTDPRNIPTYEYMSSPNNYWNVPEFGDGLVSSVRLKPQEITPSPMDFSYFDTSSFPSLDTDERDGIDRGIPDGALEAQRHPGRNRS
jgi:hypothetical protein